MKAPRGIAIAFFCVGVWSVVTQGETAEPVPLLSARGDQSTLRDHVNYLASKALHGRKPLTHGSRLAREYIETRFRACGLRPWANEIGYAQSIYIGTNIVGVLPGSDPVLKDQFILVSAHYDHLGGNHVGAADNASGVAALLAIADRIAHDPVQPKRSIVFACFDREETMLFGAYSFTCRGDYDKNKIAGVVNMDMLGRQFLDSNLNALFAVGLDRFPELHTAISRSGAFHGIEVLSIGSDIVGPRSDHVAFEDISGPCVFFSCGMFPDYHTCRDTPDKLDFDALKRSTDTIGEVVRYLTDAPALETASGDSADRGELITLQRTLPLALAAAETKGSIGDEEKKAFENAMARIASMRDAASYSVAERRAMIWEIMPGLAAVLGPALTEIDEPKSPSRTPRRPAPNYASMAHLLLCGDAGLAGESQTYRAFVGAVLKRKPFPLIRPLRFHYKRSEVSDRDYICLDQGDGRIRVSALISTCRLDASIVFILPHGASDWSWEQFDFTGTKEEAINFALLRWPMVKVSRANTTAPTGLSRLLAYDEAYVSILTRLTGENHGTTRETWLQWNLERLGFRDERTWKTSLTQSSNVNLAALAVEQYESNTKPPSAEFESLLDTLCTDTTKDARLRATAIKQCRFTPAMLHTLTKLLPDQTPCTPYSPRAATAEVVSDKTFPFYSDYRVALTRAYMEDFMRRANDKAPKTPRIKSLSELALSGLRSLTGEDFGVDVAAWRTWIDHHPRMTGAIKRKVNARMRLLVNGKPGSKPFVRPGKPGALARPV